MLLGSDNLGSDLKPARFQRHIGITIRTDIHSRRFVKDE